MPQFDTDPTILEERCYGFALESLLIEHDAETWAEDLDDAGRDAYRSTLFAELIDEFPQLEAPAISENLDSAIYDAFTGA